MLRPLAVLALLSASVHANDFVDNGRLAPENLPDYLNQFQKQQRQARLELDGQRYPLRFLDMDMEEQRVYLSFDQGVIVAELGEEPDGERELVILLGNPDDQDVMMEAPGRVLVDEQAQLTTEGDNSVFRSLLEDEQSGARQQALLIFNDSVFEAGSSSLNVVGHRAVLKGDLGTNAYLQLRTLVQTLPEVTELVFQEVPGSLFDGINLHSGRLVRQAGLTTVMPSDGEAYSGGVDLFLAGAKRVYHPGGKLGVHSWCCEEEKGADELPKSHPAHDAQLTFVREMLGPELGPEFYFYTLEVAPFDGIHLMSHDEIRHYLKPQPF
ncbi:hypothetical protein [Ferrimonas sp.]|uniref:hypothetical protein n=1 Tax=Ferrimonas sp. TaxID=2080861 RepID=UPI003A907718